MKKTAKRSLAALLALMTLVSCIGINVSAETTGFEPIRINCTMYGDSQTQRGFTWYTEKECDTTIQIIEASKFSGSFADAVSYTGDVSVFKDYYCHKVVVTGLKAGKTVISFTGFDGNGNMATKLIYVEIVG